MNEIKATVGINLNLLGEVIPKFKEIFPQEKESEYSSAGALEIRFEYTYYVFLQVSVSLIRPLTLFLDDWQWASVSATKLLLSLIQKFVLKHVLILGAYRSTEISETHSLKEALHTLKNTRIIHRNLSRTKTLYSRFETVAQ